MGVVTIRRPQSDSLPALPPAAPSANWSRADGRQLTLRKALSEERPWRDGGETPAAPLSHVTGAGGEEEEEEEREGEGWGREREIGRAHV